MLDELQRRNYSQRTATIYIHAVEDFAKYFHRSPERLGQSHIREYQVHLFRDRKLSPRTIQSRSSALRFLFVNERLTTRNTETRASARTSCTRSPRSVTTITATTATLSACTPTQSTLWPVKSKPSPMRIRNMARSSYQAKLKTVRLPVAEASVGRVPYVTSNSVLCARL